MIWKKHPKLGENYLVSPYGDIKSVERYKNNNGGLVFVPEKILKQQTTKKGYSSISIHINRKLYTFSVHRLVAECYIENNNKMPQVNHINGNKKDNFVDNLEWCNNRENITHYLKGKKHSSKYVGVHFIQKYKKWNSQIKIEGKTYSLGYKETEEEAHCAYLNALNDWNLKKIKPFIKTRHKNISFNKKRKKWNAYYIENGFKKDIGFYVKKGDAIKAKLEDEKKRKCL